MSERGSATPTTAGTAAASHESSVLEHRFGATTPYALGVEEEYMLLDAEVAGSSRRRASRPLRPDLKTPHRCG